MRGCPVHVCGGSAGLSWPAAEHLLVASAALKHLSSHGGPYLLSHWLSTPARSRMSRQAASLRSLIWLLAAEMTLAAMCAACVGCSGRQQYPSHSCVITIRRTTCPNLRQATDLHGAGCWVTLLSIRNWSLHSLTARNDGISPSWAINSDNNLQCALLARPCLSMSLS